MTKSLTFQPQPSDILIAVMGLTGSGKSTFISHCTSHSVATGASLHSDTQDISVYPCKTDIGDNIYLIDTPGFDDTELDDAQVLRKIATWVGDTYQQKIHLRGVLYLHRITDMRMQGAAIRNLFMFKKLCGQNAIMNIILVTTMWEDVKPEVGQQRENELRTTPQYWGDMIAKGANMARHQNNHHSARSIIQSLLNKTTKTTLAIQREMVDEKKELQDTSAGRELDSILNQQREKFLLEIEDLKKDMAEARKLQDEDSQEQIRLLKEQRQVEIEKILRQQESIKVDLEKLHDEKFAKLEQRLAAQQNQMEMDRKEIAGLRERLAGTSIGVNNPSSGANTMDTGSLTKPNREAGLKTIIKLEDVSGSSRYISQTAFSADARHLVVVEEISPLPGERLYSRNRVKVYDSATGVTQSVLAAGQKVSQLAVSSDGRTVVVKTNKYREEHTNRSEIFTVLEAWDSRTGKCLWASSCHDCFGGLVLSPDGRCLAFVSGIVFSNRTIRILESATGSMLRTFTTNNWCCLEELIFSPDGGRIAGRSVHSINVCNSETGSLSLTINSSHILYSGPLFRDFAFSYDGKGIAFLADAPGVIGFCDAATGSCLWTHDTIPEAWRLISSPDGYIALFGQINGEPVVQIWDPITGKCLKDVRTKRPRNLVFSPDSNRFEVLVEDEDVLEIIAL